MEYETDTEELKSQIKELRAWIRALTRRIEDLESSAFQLQEHEEVILVTLPIEDRRQRML
jgi:prefoldin subunit 5